MTNELKNETPIFMLLVIYDAFTSERSKNGYFISETTTGKSPQAHHPERSRRVSDHIK